MNTEKNIKTSFFNFIEKLSLKNFLFYNSSQSKMNFIQEHKTFIRDKIQIHPVNFVTFLSILPFILGFSQFLNQKYFYRQKNLFFEQNLPGLTIPTQTLHWDTFQYLFKNLRSQEIFIKLDKNKIIWSDKDIIITTSINDLLIPHPAKNLVAYTRLNTKNSQEKLSSKWSKIVFKEQSSDIIERFYQDLDDMPSKLEANPFFFQKTQSLTFSKNFMPFPDLKEKSVDNFNTGFNNTETKKTKLLVSYILKPTIKIEEFNKKQTVKKVIVTVDEEKKQQKVFENERTLKIEIQKLFNTTNLTPTLSFLGKGPSLNTENLIKKKLIKSDDIQFLQELIFELDKIQLPKSIKGTRLMSGYKYPDMTLNEIICFLLRKNLSNVWNLKILIPTSFLVPQISQFTYSSSPTELIYTKNLILKDNFKRETFYEGPTVTLEEQTGFDWKTKQKNSERLRFWLENYLGPTNPTHQSLQNFFGIFESPENASGSLLGQVNEKNYSLEEFSVLKTGLMINSSTSALPFTRSFQLPFITSKNWQKYLLKEVDYKDLTTRQYNTVVLPIFEVRKAKIDQPQFNFGYKNSLDFEFIHPFQQFFDFSKLKKFDSNYNQINFNLATSNFSSINSFPINLTSGNYQKIPTIFNNNNSIFFTDIWEPLTIESWLISSQIGFGFLVFKILKALADNYGRELLVYLLDLVALLGFLDDDLKQEIEILMGQREKGFRIIPKTTKNFNNIGGVQNILPEIIEIVWFLRNSGREFSISKTLPRGLLLTGPPGTGKTLLVQAIAGEAEVPVLALSGSSLLEPGESGALKLEILFQEARKVAPCIVFIDEMDTLAQKREQVLQNPMGADEILESLSNIKTTTISNILEFSAKSSSNEITDAIFTQQDTHKEKLRILMQFLVELDGIQGRDGVVVIGATNRPEMLDAAILRPGRFDRILDLGLPGPEKRGEILKLYSQNLGIDRNISWNYLINRTAGFSAADLAGIMNQSTLNAILKTTEHTIETIEYGIDRITTIGIEKPKKTENQKFLALQVAYYQAGKILLSALLEHHPTTLVTHLWPRRTNIRALQINENLQKYFFRFARRSELEHRIIGCYAGKAAEILFLKDTFSLNNLSDLGMEDIQFGQNLINHMIDNWYFYSKNITTEKNSHNLSDFNEKEYRETPDKIPFFNSIQETTEFSVTTKGEQFGNTSYSTNLLMENSIEQDAQKYFPTASWQYKISNEFEVSTRAFSDWYRLYLPDPQQTERNLEWTPPDEFYHGNDFAEKLAYSTNWNQLSNIHIDYEMHSLILQSFNKAILLLDQHREILDRLVYELLHSETLREPEVEKIFKKFNIDINLERFPEVEKNSISSVSELTIFAHWGKYSRRPVSTWMELKDLIDIKN